MNRTSPAHGHLAALVTILIWGTTFISTKVLLRALGPVEILFLRFLLVYAALWLVWPRPLAVADRRREWTFAAAGLCGVTLYYLLENFALEHTLASNVGVIISIAPFFTALFSFFFSQGEHPSPQFFAGFLLAIAGIALIGLNSRAAFSLNPAGDLLAVAAAVVWAAYSILTKRIGSFGYGTVPATRRVFFYGLLFMLPALGLLGFRARPADLLAPEIFLNLLFLGLGASALCFVTWNFAVRVLGPVKTSVYIYIVPVVTALASALLLGERLTPLSGCGMALTLGGLFLSERRPRTARAREA